MRITIIGSGIVGQATGMGFTTSGNKVKFYDIDKSRIKSLKSKGYDATDNLGYAINNSEIIFVSVQHQPSAKK